jgi:hypothetical protein
MGARPALHNLLNNFRRLPNYENLKTRIAEPVGPTWLLVETRYYITCLMKTLRGARFYLRDLHGDNLVPQLLKPFRIPARRISIRFHILCGQHDVERKAPVFAAFGNLAPTENRYDTRSHSLPLFPPPPSHCPDYSLVASCGLCSAATLYGLIGDCRGCLFTADSCSEHRFTRQDSCLLSN